MSKCKNAKMQKGKKAKMHKYKNAIMRINATRFRYFESWKHCFKNLKPGNTFWSLAKL